MKAKTAARASKVARVMGNWSGDLSFTKCLIVYFCMTPWFGLWFPLATLIVLISAAFGKSTWESYLQRGSWSTSDTTITDTKTITDRRIVGKDIGFEPAP